MLNKEFKIIESISSVGFYRPTGYLYLQVSEVGKQQCNDLPEHRIRDSAHKAIIFLGVIRSTPLFLRLESELDTTSDA